MLLIYFPPFHDNLLLLIETICLSVCVDAVVQGLSAGGVGYLAVLHAQLFEQQPGLAFLPLFVVGLVVHFFIRAKSAEANRAAEEAGAGQVRPLLLQEAKAAEGHDRPPTTTDVPPSLQLHPHRRAASSSLALDEDDSSSICSSPLEDGEGEGDDWDRDSDDRIYECYGDDELDPELFLELQQDGGDDFYPGMQRGLRSAGPEELDNLHPDLSGDSACQSSLRSSDYNISDDGEAGSGSGYDDM